MAVSFALAAAFCAADGHAATMEITSEERPDLPVFKLRGSFDLYAVNTFRLIVEPSVDNDNRDIALDFEEVGHVDSSAMGAIIQVMHRLRDDGRTVILTRVSPELQRLFGHARLDEFFVTIPGDEFDEHFPRRRS